VTIEVIRHYIGSTLATSQDGADTAQERILIRGLDQGARARLGAALSASGVPNLRDRYDSTKTRLRKMRAVSKSVETFERQPDIAVVTVGYSSRETASGADASPRVSWSVEYITETTIFDHRGDRMVVSYSASSVSSGAGATTSLTTNVARVEVERAVTSARVSRRLPRTARSFNALYLNRLNATRWSGYEPGAVRCRGFSSSPAGDGDEHDVEGLFSIAPDDGIGWDIDAVTEVESTLPDDAREGNGIRRYQLYPSADFNRSGFRIPED